MAAPTLVTGAAGFAGSHLVDLLLAQGRDVVGWYRPGAPLPTCAGVRWRAVELLDRADVQAAVDVDKPTRVFHCAGAAHVGQAWEHTTKALAANALGTHYLLDALSRSSADARVLIPSSGLVYAPSTELLREDHLLRPASPYGVSKLAQEMVGIGAVGGPRVFIARPFNHFGPRQAPIFVTAAFARQIAEIEAGDRPPVISVGNLEARRDLTDVRDTVRAYDLILEHGVAERPYNVCSGTAFPVSHILEALLRRSSVSIRVEVDPTRYRPNDTPLVVGDRTRIGTDLGWEPRTTLDTTIDDLLAYWRQRVAQV
ncbi:MAG: GDP-mannose 4,6-dehydratase [Vicinamibacterales bacterium]